MATGTDAKDTVDARSVSWQDARSRLRSVLDEYLEESSTSFVPAIERSDGIASSHSRSQSVFLRLLLWMIDHDLDIFCALAFSLSILILGGVSTSQKGLDSSQQLYKDEVAAGLLLTFGSLMSFWVTRRRKQLTLNDSRNAKRREILRFFRKYDSETDMIDEPASCSRSGSTSSDKTPEQNIDDLPGTSLTDIYPVYRIQSVNGCQVSAWSRIPSLLLIQGDIIALQVGDTTPADCEYVMTATSRISSASFKMGQLVTIESLGVMPLHSKGRDASCVPAPNTFDSVSMLPSGRVTLAHDSHHLLTLCNGMQLYRVASSPLQEFLRRPTPKPNSSHMARKVTEIRSVLFMSTFGFLILSIIITCARQAAASSTPTWFLILPQSFLAALGVAPIVGPTLIFALEVLGTARIMRSVHRFAHPLKGKMIVTKNKWFPQSALLFQYSYATIFTRLSMWETVQRFREILVKLHLKAPHDRHNRKILVRVPPASLNLLEKLGVATAVALIDDELACDPHSIPQQLLIPSAKGLKLLDLCQDHDDSSGEDSSYLNDESETETKDSGGRRRGIPMRDSDEDDSSEDESVHNYSALRRKFLNRRLKRRKRYRKKLVDDDEDENDDVDDDSSIDVQFEDPTWWQHLPSLKCIGLAGLVIDNGRDGNLNPCVTDKDAIPAAPDECEHNFKSAKSSLLRLVRTYRGSHQLRTLAECIGFSTEPNSFGIHGDLSPFSERMRLHLLSRSLFRKRLELDTHERSSEQARWWGLIRPDATSVIVQDSRSGAYQLLTVGDPAVVLNLCVEAWQGEISTILPLTLDTRKMIMETTNTWKLGDLDVAAFSFSPVSHSVENKLFAASNLPYQRYLLDHNSGLTSASVKEKAVSQEWSMIRNQVFLGILGSLLVPRREIMELLPILNESGIRFTYFSPRNMRRQKELASQMGIDVAWNCAISLRPLESGAEDQYRMVSNYADWDVNARLPHGIASVRKHLEEVDNVPLLVSLFTDVTKDSTCEMVEIFQQYGDTVIALGISHLPRNAIIFSTADIAVGIDILMESSYTQDEELSPAPWVNKRLLRPSELELVSAISSHACAFKFYGASSIANLASIIKSSRAALEAATAAGVFVTAGCVSFSLFVLFSICTPSTAIAIVPSLGSALYLQFLLPLVGFGIAVGDSDPDCMKRVPSKNDATVTFTRKERGRFYGTLATKAIPIALFPQLLYLIALGQFMLLLEPSMMEQSCLSRSVSMANWMDVIRCDALQNYNGPARTSAGAVSLAHFSINVIISSTSFLSRVRTILDLPPWRHRNHVWVGSVALALTLTVVYLIVIVPTGSASYMPWYFYLYAILTPLLCLIWSEYWKQREVRHDRRAEKLRRLQFETRLGAWSPK